MATTKKPGTAAPKAKAAKTEAAPKAKAPAKAKTEKVAAAIAADKPVKAPKAPKAGTKPAAAPKKAAAKGRPAAKSGDTITALHPIEQEAAILAQAAIALGNADSAAEWREALDGNLRVWIAIKTLVKRTDCPLPTDTRANLSKLADYVAATTLSAGSGKLSDEQKQSLVNLNLQISEGLLEGLSRERVRQRAYQLWEMEGRPLGRAEIHWYQAEREVYGNR